MLHLMPIIILTQANCSLLFFRVSSRLDHTDISLDQLQELGQDIELVWGFAHMQASNVYINWLRTRLYFRTLFI